MNDLRKAAEMALEALERLDRWLALRYGQELTQPEKDVVEALRQALAHEALDRMVAENQSLGLYECAACKKKDELIKLLKEEVGFAERGYTKRNDV